MTGHTLHRSMLSLPLATLLLVPLPALAMAHSTHTNTMMDMDMDMGDVSTGSSHMSMKMYFHGTRSDTLWFASWQPTSAGSFAAACLVLFFLGLVDRFLGGVRGSLEVRWRATVERLLADAAARRRPSHNSSGLSVSSSYEKDDHGNPSPSTKPTAENTSLPMLPIPAASIREAQHPLPSVLSLLPNRKSRWAPPFVWRVDVMRGGLQALQTAVHYTLMLAVMTFNVYFFLSIILGVGIGEILFGRFCAGPGH